MTRTWRDVQAERPDPVTEALRAWHQKADKPERDRIDFALGAADWATEARSGCDEPGCDRFGDCIWSCDGGVRRTCRQHVPDDMSLLDNV